MLIPDAYPFKVVILSGAKESPYLPFAAPQIRVPHLSNGFIVAKVGIERQLDPD